MTQQQASHVTVINCTFCTMPQAAACILYVQFFCTLAAKNSPKVYKPAPLLNFDPLDPLYVSFYHCIHRAMKKKKSQACTQITLTFLECCMQVM